MKKYNLFVLGLLSAFLVSCADDILIKDSNSEESEPTITSSEETPEGSSPSTSSDNGGNNGGGTNTNPHKNHTVYHYAARSATCTEAGNLEAWYCYNDHTYYLSNPGGIVIDTQSVITPNIEAEYYIAPLGHDLSFEGFEWNADLTEAKAVYVCSHDASHVFKEDAELEDLTAPSDQPTCYTSGTRTVRATYKDQTDTKVEHYNHLDHVPVLVKGSPATCTEDGTLDYYTCDRGCGAVLVVDELTNELREVTDLAELVDHAHGHTPANMVYENETPATCTEAGSRDEVTYCAECGIELNRYENVAISATGHAWGDWNETTAPTCTEDGEEIRTCSKCGAEETQPIEALGHAWSEWNETLAPTCQHEGEESRTCSRCQAHETRSIDALSHSYGATTYTWDANKKVVTSTRTCTSGTPHEEVEHPYSYQEPFFTCEGGRSELAGSLTEKEKNGDINLYFAHKDGDDYLSFDVDMVLHVVHDNPLTSMAENYVIRFDNGCHYTATLGINTNSGDSYVLFYTDVTAQNNKYSVGTPTDNRDLYTSYINGSFAEDYKVFAQDCINVINAKYNDSTGELTLTITYFTLVEGYERYLGYKQTFTATVDENDRNNFNYVDSLRVTRTQNGSNEVHSVIYIEELTLNDGDFHHDPLNYYSTKNWVGGESWHSQEIIDFDGHTMQRIVAKESTCTEEGNIEYYKDLSDNSYYLDIDRVNPTTLDAVKTARKAHTLTHHYEAVPATCISDGNVEYWECDVCHNIFLDENGEQEVDDVVVHNENAHTYDLDHISYELIEDNAKVRASVPCLNSEDPSHVLVKEVAVTSHEHQDATDQNPGYDRYYFEFEDDAIFTETCIEVIIPALNHEHNYNIFVETVEPTCTEQGYDVYRCSCGDTTETNLTPALGHDEVHHDAQAATCTEHGWAAYDTCSRCDYTTYEEIEALGHDLVHHDAEAATCTEHGWDAYDTCSRCDYTTYVEIPANGHTWGEWIETTAPTCEGEGVETKTCSVCGATETRPVEAIDHNYSVSFYWTDTNKTEVKEKHTCQNDTSHVYYETPYSYQEPFFTCEGGRSELAGSLTTKEKNGDINFYFTHKDGGNKLSFNVDLTLRVVHDNNLPSMKDNFVIRFDNGCHYKATLGVNTNSGDSYALFYTDLTTGNKTYSVGTPTDNSNLYTSYINESFAEDYKVFASYSVVLIHAEYDGSTGELTLTITYFTLVEGYERYLGYRQTFTATVDQNDRDNFNIVDSLRITRVEDSGHNVDSKIYIEDITRNSGTYDYDVLNYYSAHDGWFGAESWHSQEIIDVDGHDLEYYPAVEPTCTEPGHEAYYKCKTHDNEYYSGELETQKLNSLADVTIPASGHTWGEWSQTTAPTCTEKGEETRTCSVCGATDTREVAAKGHTPAAAVNENVTAPTCEEDGSHDEVVYCSVCGVELSREEGVVDAASGHDLVHHDAQAATCTEHGWAAYDTCSRCDYTTYEEVAALGHDWSDWEVTTDPTCTEDGEETRTCSRCDIEEHRSVDATGHNYQITYVFSDDYSTVTATRICLNDSTDKVIEVVEADITHTTLPTENTKGLDTYSYTFTHDFFNHDDVEVEVNELAHTHNIEHVGRVESDCKTVGHIEYWHCTKCNKNYSDEGLEHEVNSVALPLSSEHNPGEAVIENSVAPTCTEDGSHDEVIYCETCDAELSRETKVDNALGHSWGDWVETTAPTCTEKGEETRTCSVCGATETREVAAKGHTPAEAVHEHVIAPTCTTAGSHDEVVYCSVCEAELSREEGVVDIALGHDLVHHDAQAATCTEHGWDAYDTCSRCDYTTYEEIAALGHSPKDPVVENEVAPTCEEAGSHDEVVYCDRCNAELSRESQVDAAIGHNYSVSFYWTDTNKTEVKEKHTCQNDGSHIYYETPYSYEEPFFTCEGGRSELAGSLTTKEKNGDINIFFSNVNGDNSKGASFTTDLVLRIEHDNNLPSMKDNISIRFDNGCHYKANFIGYNPNSGDSYALFYTDLTTGNKTYSVGTPTDNRSLYTSYINESFAEDYKVFASNCVVLIHAEYDGSTGELTLTITYFTLVSGYERYLGYKQTFTATVDENDRTSFNVVNSLRITRMIYNSSDKSVDSTIKIEGFNYTGTLDYDVINTYTNNGSSWNKKTIYQYNGHTLQKVAANEATCTEEGNVEYYKCLAHENEYYLDLEMTSPTTLEDVTLSATGHNYGEAHYESVNGDDEIRAYRICGNDETHIEEETVNTVYSVVTAPTCTEKGQGKYTATFENEAFGTRVKYVDIDALGHDWNEPTYVWNGDNSKVIASRICSRCDAVESEEVATSSEVIKVATELEAGTRRYTSASFENEAFEVQTKDVEIPVLSHVHNYNTFVETVAPTCTEQGYDIYKCSCDETTHINYVSATGHSWGEWSQTTAPTCTEKGEETRTCSVCGATDTREVIALGHNLVHHDATEATCEEDGYDEHWTCSTCNKVFLDSEASEEVELVTITYEATGEHTWVGPCYTWDENKTNIYSYKYCEENEERINLEGSETIYETTNNYIYSYTDNTDYSNLASNRNGDKKYGDVNVYFSNTASNTNEKSFILDMNLKIQHSTADTSESRNNLFFIQICNSSWYSGRNGTDYVTFDSSMNYSKDDNTSWSVTKGTYTTGFKDTAPDSRNSSEALTASFWNDFYQFTSDCNVLIRVTYNGDGTFTITYTYYTRVAGYEKYFGYTQSMTATLGSDKTWNYINTVQLARTANTGMKLYIESISYSRMDDTTKTNIDRDIVGYADGSRFILVDVDGKNGF